MKNNLVMAATIAAVTFTVAPPVAAKQFWADYSVSYLQGSDYLDPFTGTEYDSGVITLEHASGHSWGSTFSFVDFLDNQDGYNDETYGEVGANFNLGNHFGKPDEGGFVKDYYVAGQVEFQTGSDGFENYLLGFGMDLNVPGASYFSVTYYRRNNDDLGIGREDNDQLTIAWGFDHGNWRFDGFWDIRSSTENDFGDVDAAYNFTPQLKYNIGKALLGMDSGRLDVGVEYVYWKNKFGVDGQTEKNANLLVKWHY
ncbi:MAG: outer membrane protein OmpK [Candidatus Pelagadaptatus aseana]|uniref:hypothetical protein n=1 Tax=Candidatus Pelagadaptatus aseana TaxID=3120508 RepID=UPI0039B3538A